MSPPPLLVVGVGSEEEEDGRSAVTLLASSGSMESNGINGTKLKERNYMGLTDCSSLDSSANSSENKVNLNIKATELRLGLPGSQSPERNSDIFLGKFDEKTLFPLHPSKDLLPQKTIISGNKRGFSDAMENFPKGKFLANSDVNVMPSNTNVKSGTAKDCPLVKEAVVIQHTDKERTQAANDKVQNNAVLAANNNSNAPATKAQLVGWPPVRSYRKNTLATSSKNSEELEGKAGLGLSGLLIKVSMDGAPYLRKVDLRNYSTYPELSSALEKMFSCFTIGQYGSQGKEMLNEWKLKDLLSGSEYVLTYEDKDADWMLVGDVPWEMFIDTCKRLRIMRSSDAIGLAPRAMEKSQSTN
ncbi:auxin-responsive protein IAA8-like [Impatiens glandulifera]|uniref:auxin-responsive protein IAA8-like n=1 Tax=Impatiens glandulifera TaxID=253017 RepID=UPI001FB158A8|nr:auxin-responsive protein IAA8-like [Impatiens glandulifera]